jgi:hypothetical protein
MRPPKHEAGGAKRILPGKSVANIRLIPLGMLSLPHHQTDEASGRRATSAPQGEAIRFEDFAGLIAF